MDTQKVQIVHADTPQAVTVDVQSTKVQIYVEARAVSTVVLWPKDISELSIEVFIGEEADCTVIFVLQSVSTSTCNVSQWSHVEAGGKVHWQNVTIGGAAVTQALISEIAGHDAESSVDWVFYARGKEHLTLSARNVFLWKNGGGEIVMKGVAEERAHVQAKGLIEIGSHGGGTNTYLTQEVLMLDPTAKVDAVPGLEIKTNDVKASHSASVARVTPEDLFYFASRGIEEMEARGMFIEGFLGDLLEKIHDVALRLRVHDAVTAAYRRYRGTLPTIPSLS